MTKESTYYFSLLISVAYFVSACTDTTDILTMKQAPNSFDTINVGCLVSYDINPADNKEKINQIYGKQHIKEGHWIKFRFITAKNNKKKADQVKIEEGYYRKNKKSGYWKYFNDDGVLKDSIEFKNNILVIR